MTFTSSDLDQLKAALLTGATSVSIGGRTVSFRSLAELRSLISEIEAKIAADADPTATPGSARTVKATFKKV